MATLRDLCIGITTTKLEAHESVTDKQTAFQAIQTLPIVQTLKKTMLESRDWNAYRKYHELGPYSEIVCKLCKRNKFQSFGQLNIHLRQQHDKVYAAPYNCRICRLPFVVVKNLKHHEVSCEKLRLERIPTNYRCPICSNTYFNGIEFAGHLRWTHKL